jgi:hypothetical protein
MLTKGKVGRAVGTPVGFFVGFAGGLGAWMGIQGGLWGNKNQGAAIAALSGIVVAGTVGGYLLGNSVDKHWTAIEILP